MMYINSKCGNCKTSLSGGYKSQTTIQNLTRLGPEIRVCYKCKCENKTGRIPYNKMDKAEKGWVLIVLGFHCVVFGAMFGYLISAGIIFGLIKLSVVDEEKGFSTVFFITSIIIVPLLIFIYGRYEFKSFFKDVKSFGYSR